MTDSDTAAPAAPEPPPKAAFLTRLSRHGYVLLALFCVLLWLPGIVNLPALDRDESRYAQSSRQMLDSGNYVDIRFGQVPRYKKPVGIYWLQAAATAAAGFGDRSHIWTYRLPSLLGGVLAVWATFWCTSLVSAEAGLIAGVVLAASLLLTAEATIATTDAVLLACITAMQGVLLRVWRAAKENAPIPSTRLILAGWAALAAGVLVKGPVAPAVAAVTILALFVYDRQWKDGAWKWLAQTRPLPGFGLVLLITMPWLIAIAIQSHGAFFQQSLGGDFATKLAEGQEGHGALPGYYLLLSTLTLWPAILYVLPGIGFGVMRRADPMIRFLLAWAGAAWLLMEIVPTKLPNYVLPACPPLAILAALWLLAPRDEEGWRKFLPWVAALQFLIGLAAVTAAPLWLPGAYSSAARPLMENWPLLLTACLGALSGFVALVIFLLGRRALALVPLLLATLILFHALTGWTGPRLDQLWISQRLAVLVARDRQQSDPPPMLAGYQEPSLVFALGADVDLTDGRGAAEHGAAHGGLALVDDEQRPNFLARLAELEATATATDELSGFNYSRGKRTHITLYRVAPLNPGAIPTVR